MNFDVLSLGCKVSQYDAAAVSAALSAAGHTRVELETGGGFAPEAANIFDSPPLAVICTCAVTVHSEKKASDLIALLRRRYPGVIIAMCGCLPALYFRDKKLAQHSAEHVPEAEITAGTNAANILPDLVSEYLAAGQKVSAFAEDLYCGLPDTFDEPAAPVKLKNTRAFLKIEDGCDRGCAYCAVPGARGKQVRSRSIENIAAEAERFSENHREIVLTGVNLARYGTDLESKPTVIEAVRAAAKPEKILRVRLSSFEPEPGMLTKEFFSQLQSAAGDKFTAHIHLPLQSGCDATLLRMRRIYTAEWYRQTVGIYRELFGGNASVSTDIIVGFDGESDKEFDESLRFVKDLRFSKIHVFPFSPRPGTIATKLNIRDEVSSKEKRARYDLMKAAATQSRADYIKGLIGTKQRVIIEKPHDPAYVQGMTDGGVMIRLYGADTARHTLVKVRVTSAENEYGLGEIIT